MLKFAVAEHYRKFKLRFAIRGQKQNSARSDNTCGWASCLFRGSERTEFCLLAINSSRRIKPAANTATIVTAQNKVKEKFGYKFVIWQTLCQFQLYYLIAKIQLDGMIRRWYLSGMSTQHTPGPWTDRDDGTNAQITAIGNESIALVYSGGGKYPGNVEQRANASLIAAAPEMFKKLVEYAQAFPDAEALAIIAKAEGTVNEPRLPKGAKRLSPPIKKVTGGWVEQMFDAKLQVFNITWLRVKDGMGGDGKREDWVADIPGTCISVHDYHWNGEKFGENHGSFLGAIKAETKIALQCALDDEQKLLKKLAAKRKGIILMRKSITSH